MTRPFLPDMVPGTMLMFPSPLVHGVNPYPGARPRITLSWNLSPVKPPGEALPV
jgi:Putative 2OG-Fe(II) oxygenase